MAFIPEPTRTSQEIGNIAIVLKDAVATTDQAAYQSAHFDVKIVLSDGTVITRRGDLVPHITPVQRTALMDFMDGLRLQAEQEILP